MRRLLIAVCALGSSSCLAGPGQYLKAGFTPPASVAVLPLSNYTTDLNAPDAVRFWFGYRLSEKKGYHTLPLEIVDAKLREAGISDGGQLKTLTPRQLGERLGADAVVFGDLLEFTYQTAGALPLRRVRARWRLVDCRTGEKLWEAEGVGENSGAAVSSPAAAPAGPRGLGVRIAEGAAASPLKAEIWDMIWNSIEDLPPGR